MTQSSSRGQSKNVVYSLSRPSRCHGCDRKLIAGEIVKLKDAQDDKEAFCFSCAELDAFEVVAKGNAKITRLAIKYSSISYIVMQWSDTWKCYERVGILATGEAIDRAQLESGMQLPQRGKTSLR
jgi:hypothetical protein